MVLGCFLLVVGTSDLVRTAFSRLDRGRPEILAIANAVLTSIVVIHTVDAERWLVWILAVPAVAWVIATTPSLSGRLGLWPAVGLLSWGAGLLAFGHSEPNSASWISRINEKLAFTFQSSTPTALVVVVGCVLFLLESSNVLVSVIVGSRRELRDRVTLEHDRPDDAIRPFRGGRLIGPLERLLILGLALAGQYAAIGGVVAAKGIVRFPEITAGADKSSNAEYFLVGSLASWGIALLATVVLTI